MDKEIKQYKTSEGEVFLTEKSWRESQKQLHCKKVLGNDLKCIFEYVLASTTANDDEPDLDTVAEDIFELFAIQSPGWDNDSAILVYKYKHTVQNYEYLSDYFGSQQKYRLVVEDGLVPGAVYYVAVTARRVTYLSKKRTSWIIYDIGMCESTFLVKQAHNTHVLYTTLFKGFPWSDPASSKTKAIEGRFRANSGI